LLFLVSFERMAADAARGGGLVVAEGLVARFQAEVATSSRSLVVEVMTAVAGAMVLMIVQARQRALVALATRGGLGGTVGAVRPMALATILGLLAYVASVELHGVTV
jgi:hypothetical protein